DKSPSFSASRGNDGRILMTCHAGCDLKNICAAIPVNVADLFPQKIKIIKPRYVFDCAYDYRDEKGDLLFQVVRRQLDNPSECPDSSAKKFFQRRPDGKGGWINDLKGVRRVLYRLPELIAANPGATVFICEGEKDIERLRALSLEATTNPGGAGKW